MSDRSGARGTQVGMATLFAALSLAACGSAGPTPPSASPTPKGPPTAQLTVVGGPGVATALSSTTVTCSLPGLNGSSITVATRNFQAPLYVRVNITPTTVTVSAGAGSGANAHGRSFMGSGVTHFNVDSGATIDSTLTEAPSPSPGTIPSIMSISGRVDCGNLTPGSSTIRFTGDIPEGHLDSTLSPVHVACYSPPTSGVQVIGLTTVGTARVYLSVFWSSTSFSIVYTNGTSAYFGMATPAGETVTTMGGQITGDDTLKNGSASLTMHVSGSATCGGTVPG